MADRLQKTSHGGPGRGQGRKPVKTGEATVTVSLRLTSSQRDKLSRLGGAAWVRNGIDAAVEISDSTGGSNSHPNTDSNKQA